MGHLIEYLSICPLPTFAQSSAQNRGVFSGDYSTGILLKEKLCGCMHIGNLPITIAITTTTVMSMTPSYKHLSFGI